MILVLHLENVYSPEYETKRDLKDLEIHLLDTGHFALEEAGQVMAKYIRDFLGRKVSSTKTSNK